MVVDSIEERELLAKSGDPEAIISLADFFHENGNDKKAFAMLSYFSHVSNPLGYRKLGNCYLKGIGTEVDVEKAMLYFEKSYELGDLDAGFQLARIYLDEKDYPKALMILSYGKTQNHVPSIKLLASLYQKGEGVQKNEEIAIKLFLLLTELGQTSFFDNIGHYYYKNGDFLKALDYFKKGSLYNEPNCLYHLGIMHAKGQGTSVDMVKAIHYYELGANQGHEKCLYNLYVHYKEGIGVKKDLTKAELYLNRYENCKKMKK